MGTSSGARQLIDLTGDDTADGSARRLMQQQQTAGRRASGQQARGGAGSQSSEDILEQRVRSALRRERYPIGPKLASLRRSQEARNVREYYGVEHLKRLLKHECNSECPARTKQRCKDVHGPGCRDCRTCHFCRQKTTDEKTCCPCEHNRNQPGGAGRGIWCGNCLQLRMGENVREILRLPYGQWRCPACRSICNCSGANCQRASRQLDVTEQLAHEASGMGYKSVAHYLILTALDEGGFVGPMVEVSTVSREGLHRQPPHTYAAQQQADAAAALPRALHTAAVFRAQAEQRRIAAERRRQELLAAVAAVLPPIVVSKMQSAVGVPGITPPAVCDTDGDDEDDDDDVRDSAIPVSLRTFNSSMQRCNSHRTSSTSDQQQQGHVQQDGACRRLQPVTPAAAPGSLLSPRHGLGCRAFTGLPLLGIPGDAAAGPSPTLRDGAKSATPALPKLSMLGGPGVLGFANSWRERVVSPVPGAAAVGPPDVEAGSRPAAPAAVGRGSSGSALSLQQQYRHQQLQEKLQQQQQPQRQGQHGGQQGLRQQPAADEGGRLRLQRLQGVEEQYGRHDLLGGDVPGYKAGTHTWHGCRPVSSSNKQCSTTGRQPSISGWPSAATAGLAGTPKGTSGPVPAHGTQYTEDDLAQGADTSTGAAGPYSQSQGVPAPRAAPAFLSNQGAVRSAEAAGLIDASPAKRMCTDGPSLHSQAAAAAGLGAGTTAGAAVASKAGGTQAPDAAVADNPAQQQSGQHQQQQRPQAQEQEVRQLPDARGAAAGHAEATEPQHRKQAVRAADVQQLRQTQGGKAGRGSSVNSVVRNVRLISQELEQTFADWDSPLVVNRFAESESNRAAVAAHVTKLGQGITALLDLAQALPLIDVGFAVVGRLDGSTGAFLDFKHSDPIARATVINAWSNLMAILINRGDPRTALAAAHSSLTSAAAASQHAAAKAVQKAITSSIETVHAGWECMRKLVVVLLDWLSVFQAEYGQLHRLQHSPQDLLGPITVGHIKWPSAHLQQHQQSVAGPAAWQLQQQEQMRQEEVRQQRLLELSTLAQADSSMLCSLLARVCQLSRKLPRQVAAAVLDGGHLSSILDMNLLWPVDVCTHALSAVKALTAAAAPDLQDASRWFVEDPDHLKQLLAERQQPQTHHQYFHQGQQAVPGQQEVVQQQLTLFRQVVYSQLAAALQAAEVANLAQVAKQHLLLPLEQLVAAEFPARDNWVKDNFLPKLLQQQQQPQPPPATAAALPWFLQKGGVQQPAAVAAGAAQKVRSLQQQEEQEQHSFKLGGTKVETLARIYALQLQAGALSWQQMEKQLVAPASSLNQLLESFQNLQLRKLVIKLAAEISKHAPSAIQWQQQQQVHQLRPFKQTVLPAEWLLRLWVRSMLDTPNRSCRRLAGNLTLAMLEVPATAGLFRFLSDGDVQYLISDLEQDQYGELRAGCVRQVAEALLAGRHTASGGTGGGVRGQEFRDVFNGLPQVLQARQSELEKCRQHTHVLLWQRACMLSVLGLAAVTADTLATCNCLAPGAAAGVRAAGAPSAPTHLIVGELKRSVTELLGLASSWMRYGVAAVCGRVDGNSSIGGGVTGAASAASTAIQHQEALTLIVQGSALAKLRDYLVVLVHLTGLGCRLDDISTDLWPADTNSSNTLRRVCAQATAAQQAQQRQQRLGGHQQKHGPNTPALSLNGLSELLLAVVQLASAGDILQPNEQALFSYVAEALAECSGFSPTAAAAPGGSAGSGGSGASAPTAAAEVAKIPEGYCSPGLLHLLLGSHIRVLLYCSCDRGTAAAHSKAVNALHLVRALLQQPGVLEEYGQRLLLPCVARPLVKLLSSASASLAVQYQVYQLLQEMFSGPTEQTLQQTGQTADAGQSVGWNGCLRSATPLEPGKLQQMLQLLLTVSIRSCLAAVAAPLRPSAANDVESHIRERMDPQQQQQQCLFPLQAAEVQTLELQLQNNITGSLPVVSAQLNGALAAAEYSAGNSCGAVTYGAERPEDYTWTLAKAALAYCASLARLQSCVPQLLRAAKFMVVLLQKGGITGAPLLDAFADFTKQFPERLNDKWTTLLDALRRQVAQQQRQQQQQRMAPPSSRPPQAGLQSVRQAGQQVQQQQRHTAQQPQPRHRPPTPPVVANNCSSQVGSVACGGRQQQVEEVDSQGGTRAKRARIAVPAESDVYSSAGGRAASCSVLPSQQQLQQHMQRHEVQRSQTPPQLPLQPLPAVPVGQRVCAAPVVRAPAAAAGAVGGAVSSPTAADIHQHVEEEEDVSSSASGASSSMQPDQVKQPPGRLRQQQQQIPEPQDQPGARWQIHGQQTRQLELHQAPQQQQQRGLQQVPQQPSQQSTPQQHPSQKQRQQQPSDHNMFVVFGQLLHHQDSGGGQLQLRMRRYCQPSPKTFSDEVVVVRLSGALAGCVLDLLKQGRVTNGVLLGIKDVLQTQMANTFVPSETSKIILEPQGGDPSGGKPLSATRAPAAGKENAAAACSGDSATLDGACNRLDTVPAQGIAAEAGAGNAAAAAQPPASGDAAELISSDVAHWRSTLKPYEHLKHMYEEQQACLQASKSQVPQKMKVQNGPEIAALGAAAAAEDAARNRQQSPARPTASAVQDSQATIKYATQQTEV